MFLLFLFLKIGVFATVRILTFHYNQPDFIEIQYKTLTKFLKDDFEIIVFNDAKTEENEIGISDICAKYEIECVRFQSEWHNTNPLNDFLKEVLQDPSTIGIWGWNASTTIEEIANHPSVRHSHVIQYALDHYGYDHDDIVVLMDGDCFIIQPHSIREILGNHDLVGVNQIPDYFGKNRKILSNTVPKKEERPWVVFIAFDPQKLPNVYEMQFHVDREDNLEISDTGAAIYKYFRKYPDLNIATFYWQDTGIFREYFSRRDLLYLGFQEDLIAFIKDIAPGNVQLFMNEHFMHFSAVSAETAYHRHKIQCLHKFINKILETKNDI